MVNNGKLRCGLIIGLLLAAGTASAAIIPEGQGSTLDTPQIDLSTVPLMGGPGTRNDQLSAAMGSIRRGNVGEAISTVKAFLAQHPDSAPAHELLGMAQALMGDLKSALSEMKKATEINPAQSTAFTKMGEIYLADGQQEQAKAALERAISIDPSDRQAHQRLGLIAEREGRIEAAIGHYEKGLEGTPPDYLGVKINLAALYTSTGHPEKAEQLLKDLVTEKTDSAQAHLVLGGAYQAQDRYPEAITEYNRALDISPDSRVAKLSLGVALREAGDAQAGLKQIEEVAAANSDWAPGQYYLALTLAGMGRLDDAQAHLENAVKLNDKSFAYRQQLGELYLQAGKPVAAAAVFEELSKWPDAGPRVFQALGTSYQRANNLPKAQAAYETMAKRFPKDPSSFLSLGSYYAYLQKYSEAGTTLEKGLALAPDDPGLLKAMSGVELRQGKIKDAVASAERLVAARPEDMQERFYLATLYELDHNADKAAQAYQYILQKDGKNVGSLNNLAVIEARKGELQEALKLSRKAHDLAPDAAEVADTHGWILYQSGNATEAATVLRRAVGREPRDPAIYYHLAVVENALGHDEAAKSNLQAALTMKVPFKEQDAARQLLDSL